MLVPGTYSMTSICVVQSSSSGAGTYKASYTGKLKASYTGKLKAS